MAIRKHDISGGRKSEPTGNEVKEGREILNRGKTRTGK